jgi:hypothetical protein
MINKIKGLKKFGDCSMPSNEKERINKAEIASYNQAIDDVIKLLNLHIVSDSESSSIRIFKLECLTEDGDMETNGYYRTKEAAELKKAELDKYRRNIKYGIKQQIVEIDLED